MNISVPSQPPVLENEEDQEDHSDCKSLFADTDSGISTSGYDTLKGQTSASILGGKETQALRSIRLIAIFGVFCAIPLAVSVYFYTSKDEEDDFQQQFQEYALKVLEAIGSTFENSFGALDNLAVSFVASASAANQTFPNIRVHDFAVSAAKTLSLSKAKVLVTCPVVTDESYDEWTNWTAKEGIAWVEETLQVQKTDENFYGPIIEDYSTLEYIYSEGGTVPREEGKVYLPTWQAYPIIPSWPPYNYDYLTALAYTTAHSDMLKKGKITITNPYLNPDPSNEEEMKVAQVYADWLYGRIHPDEEPLEPASDLYFPIRNNVQSVTTDSTEYPPVATFAVTFYWRDKIRDILPETAKGILVVVENPCSAAFTYRLDGPKTTLLGRGNHRDPKYDEMELQSLMSDLSGHRILESTYSGPELDEEHCPITFRIYPSQTTEDAFKTANRWVYSGVTVLTCFVATILFLMYDRFQERRQKVIMESAQKSNAVVSSLFPTAIREKLYASQKAERAMMTSGGNGVGANGSRAVANVPIAELYTHTTVSFADIAGFTAWASTREASDVFTLLESIYYEFDIIARKHRVFKVETVGDSYVAVCGLPEPRKNHAIAVARFCSDCRKKMNDLTKDLVTTLGPGTESLCMRYGMNSGPTTAGVLRGDRSRFQLFGDTANTAARMESSSIPNRIQASQKTADLLIAGGKEEWVTKRDETVNAKGKGIMTTYWVEPDETIRRGDLANASGRIDEMLSIGFSVSESRLQQLINFNVEVLENLLKNLVAHNLSTNGRRQRKSVARRCDETQGFEGTTPRQEIVEVIPVPKYENETSTKIPSNKFDPSDIQLPSEVLEQIRSFVMLLSHNHKNDNPFHNFDHATHVAMSVRKLLARILKPLAQQAQQAQQGSAPNGKNMTTSSRKKVDSILKSTYILTSDPMIQFAVYFSALIHDADHPGVSNGTLSAEQDPVAMKFGNASSAEQNSIVIGWDLFMSPSFADLRSCIFGNDHNTANQIQRFRQLVINAVMATDIFDSELKSFRERRWGKAFPNDEDSAAGYAASTTSCDIDYEGELRATIVIEHIIQASDIVHTMQHWTVYQKWNERLFAEMRAAYQAGRTEKDPAIGWYRGELWFFDHYIIPLAKKLKECGVFGVSCDEVLDYARDNRMEWEQKGEGIVQQWVEQAVDVAAEAEAEAEAEAATSHKSNPGGTGKCSQVFTASESSSESSGSSNDDQHSLSS